jgi:hypothetical protein
VIENAFIETYWWVANEEILLISVSLQGIRVEEIDTDGLLKLDEDHLLCLQV